MRKQAEDGKFIRASLGSKKVASINMRREEHQFVIDGFLIDEVLKQIPPGIKIIQAYVHLIKRDKEQRIAVPNALRKYGITMIRNAGLAKRASMIFDATNKENIKQNISKACIALDMPYQKAYFRYVVLSNADGTVKFEHCTKEIKPDELDQRKKLRVLGATEGSGKVQSLIAALGAKKFRCVIKEEPVKLIMCSRE